MRKIIAFIAITVTIISLSSCMKLHQEYWVSKDGSGKYAISIDASDMLSMMKNMDQMFNDESQNYGMDEDSTNIWGEAEYDIDESVDWYIYPIDDTMQYDEDYFEEEVPDFYDNEVIEYNEIDDYPSFNEWENEVIEDIEPTIGDYIKDAIDKIMEQSKLKSLDTVMNIYSLLPDSILATIENPEDLKDFNFHINMDSAEFRMVFGLDFTFSDMATLKRKAQTFKIFDKENPGEEIKQFIDDDITQSFVNYFTQLIHGNELVIDFKKPDNFPGVPNDGESEESYLEFMRQFMGGLEIKTSYHFPGRKIKNISVDKYIISKDKSSVEVIFVLEDFISNDVPEKLIIQFE